MKQRFIEARPGVHGSSEMLGRGFPSNELGAQAPKAEAEISAKP